ncbi:hypothetical protein [Mumia zhuanghuii]|uniref:hypothetical protein n=1 Tax=Mumia zhuanghuii TaxID=2585211 RepID=UPI00129CD5EC|nr:hypothetical protein [Mumia zhuanghuii]
MLPKHRLWPELVDAVQGAMQARRCMAEVVRLLARLCLFAVWQVLDLRAKMVQQLPEGL